MRKALSIFALLAVLAVLAVLAPFAAASEAPADAVQPAADAPAVEPAPVELEPDLEALFAEVDPDHGAEDRYLCTPGYCTTEWDCEMNQEPASCSNRMCDNPTGQACRGTCFCC